MHPVPPHTAKRKLRCPYCESARIVKKGIRKKKLEAVQLWRCNHCRHVFTPGPASLRHKTYPLKVILDGLTTYNLGYSLAETAKKLSKRYSLAVVPSSVDRWLHKDPELVSYRRLRTRGNALFPPTQTICSIKLYHRQVYEYSYHRAKLALLRKGQLDDKRRGSTHFAAVADFLESISKTCPHNLFTAETDGRASQARLPCADIHRSVISRKENVATQTAALVIPTVGSNCLRHPRLQRFMLANDSTTLAVEVPIWLDETHIAALERQYGIELASPTKGRRVLTGHIDFLQVRNGAVHILDYKPDARTDRPTTQLMIYALALTRLVPGLKLFDIKCACFNEEEYCEFFPRPLVEGRYKERQESTPGDKCE